MTDDSLGCSSQAIRTIIFDVHSTLGRNAGVLVAWIALSCVTTILFTRWLRHYELDSLALLNPMSKVEDAAGSGTVSRNCLNGVDEEVEPY